jgi:predicted dehydrogenase
MSDSIARLGLVGLRGINLWMYIPAINAHPRAELVAGCDPSDKARDVLGEKSDAPAFTSLKEMADNVELDGVMIGTPNHIHLINVREAVECGLGMCVTKPLMNSVAECRKAIALCEKAGLVLASGHEYRYQSIIAEMRRRVAAGEIGEVSMVKSHMGHRGGLGKLTAKENWRSNKENVPGGCANMLGTHCFDMLNALLGEPVAVSAVNKRLITESPLEDTSALLVEYASGKIGIATSSYCSCPSDWVHVYGTMGNLRADTRSNRLIREDEKGNQEELEITEEIARGCGVIETFVHALMDGERPETGGPEGLASVALLEASIKASDEGRRVTVDEIMSSGQ